MFNPKVYVKTLSPAMLTGWVVVKFNTLLNVITVALPDCLIDAVCRSCSAVGKSTIPDAVIF